MSALLGDLEETQGETPAKAQTTIAIDMIRPNPEQPRRRFAEAEISELADSIRERGIIQPLILRPAPSGDGFEIVAGERRWRAAQKAQLHAVPAIVRELDDATVLEFAIIENVQRADLTPVEESRGYARLMEEFGHTQEELAEVVGKSRSYIANALRLLNLSEEVLDLVSEGKLSAGHARALITAEDPAALARQVVARGLSVRETEALVKAAKPMAARPARNKPAEKDADTRALELDLSANLGMKVRIEHKGEAEGGEIRVRYGSLEELDALCERLSR
ncbi:MAG: ParB/RepB/Spo0J family partition protein [Pseudomonadota bacterium]